MYPNVHSTVPRVQNSAVRWRIFKIPQHGATCPEFSSSVAYIQNSTARCHVSRIPQYGVVYSEFHSTVPRIQNSAVWCCVFRITQYGATYPEFRNMVLCIQNSTVRCHVSRIPQYGVVYSKFNSTVSRIGFSGSSFSVLWCGWCYAFSIKTVWRRVAGWIGNKRSWPNRPLKSVQPYCVGTLASAHVAFRVRAKCLFSQPHGLWLM
jgi:hypothetical protein